MFGLVKAYMAFSALKAVAAAFDWKSLIPLILQLLVQLGAIKPAQIEEITGGASEKVIGDGTILKNLLAFLAQTAPIWLPIVIGLLDDDDAGDISDTP